MTDVSNDLNRAALALGLFVASTYINAENKQENAHQDEAVAHMNKVELTTDDNKQSADDNKTINWKDALKIYECQGDVLPQINGNLVMGYSDVSLKKGQREYNKDQKEAFRKVRKDFEEVDSIKNPTDIAAYYSTDDKKVHLYFYNIINDMKAKKDSLENVGGDANTEKLQKLNLKIDVIEQLNDPNSIAMLGIKAHEYNHRMADQRGTHAPGLNSEEYAKLDMHDEIAANVAHLHVLEHFYKEELKAGKSQEEALKVFDVAGAKNFSFYKDALKNGLDPNSEEATKLKVQGTFKMWNDEYKDLYQDQTYGHGAEPLPHFEQYHAITLAIGDKQEYKKRYENIYDHIKDNKIIKDLGISVSSHLSDYLPQNDVELTPLVKHQLTIKNREYTGITVDEAQKLSDAIPGDQKSDVKKIVRLFKEEMANIKVTTEKNPKTKEEADKIIIHQISANRGR